MCVATDNYDGSHDARSQQQHAPHPNSPNKPTQSIAAQVDEAEEGIFRARFGKVRISTRFSWSSSPRPSLAGRPLSRLRCAQVRLACGRRRRRRRRRTPQVSGRAVSARVARALFWSGARAAEHGNATCATGPSEPTLAPVARLARIRRLELRRSLAALTTTTATTTMARRPLPDTKRRASPKSATTSARLD